VRVRAEPSRQVPELLLGGCGCGFCGDGGSLGGCGSRRHGGPIGLELWKVEDDETMRKATTENGLRERRLTDVALSEVRARGGNSTNCLLFALQWGRGSFPIPEYDRIKILIPKTSCKGLIGFSGLAELIAQFRRPTPPDQPQRRKKGSSIYSFGGAVDHDDKTNGLRIS